VKLDKRKIEKLEAKYGSSFARVGKKYPTSEALEDYFTALEGGEVEERYDPELEAYFRELEEREARRETTLKRLQKGTPQ
jgi:hypothetical protein